MRSYYKNNKSNCHEEEICLNKILYIYVFNFILNLILEILSNKRINIYFVEIDRHSPPPPRNFHTLLIRSIIRCSVTTPLVELKERE